MSQNEKEAPPKNWALVRLVPSIALDELEDEVDVKAFLQFDLVLFLYFAHDTYQVQKGILYLNRFGGELSVEILIQNLLDKGVASRVEFLQQFLYQVLCKQVEGAVVLQIVLKQELFVFVFNKVLRV